MPAPAQGICLHLLKAYARYCYKHPVFHASRTAVHVQLPAQIVSEVQRQILVGTGCAVSNPVGMSVARRPHNTCGPVSGLWACAESTCFTGLETLLTDITNPMTRHALQEGVPVRTCNAAVGLELQVIQAFHSYLDPGVHSLPVLSIDVSTPREALGAQLLQASVEHFATGAEMVVRPA